MEALIKCLNILSTTIVIIASIYAMAACPWLMTEGIELAVGAAVILNTAVPMQVRY